MIRITLALMMMGMVGFTLPLSVAFSQEQGVQEIPSEFAEVFGGGEGFRFKVRNVQIDNGSNTLRTSSGGMFQVKMEILHDCSECGNAINQIIVGLHTDEKAQVCVWNGKQRSGGPLMVVNFGTPVAAICQDNPDQAEWVTVYFTIHVPKKNGIYYLRTRYAQDYQGSIYTKEALEKYPKQSVYEKPLGWWKVDRPNGPGAKSNIGVIIVESRI